RVPEHGRIALVRDVLEHAGDLSVLHFVERLTRELEVVALMVDRPGATVSDENAALGGGHDVVDADVPVARQERHIRHPLELNRVPRLGERAAVRSRDAGELLYPRHLLARRLVILEQAL